MAVLADAVLIIHFLFVAFVVGGLPFIWIGAACGWRIARNFRFRVLHLAAIIFVSAEALIGMACPLTVWEDRLRGRATDHDFIARWLHHVLYYDFPAWVFVTAYVLFAAAVAATFRVIAPNHRGNSK